MAFLGCCGRALLIVFTFSAATAAECVSLVSAAAASARSGGGVTLRRTSPESPMAQAAAALRALDTDSSGAVERGEMEAFAQQRGLSSSQVFAEFQGLDTNGDGELGSDEIARALGSDTANAKASASGTASAESKAAGVVPPPPEPVSEGSHSSSSAPAALPREERVSVESPPTVAAPTNDDPLQETAVMQEARSQAGAVLAAAFEGSASSSLKERQQNVEKAVELESLAKKLRGEAATLSSSAKEHTAAAAADAAEQVLNEARAQVKQLEQSASVLELEARGRREKARHAMDLVSQAEAKLRATMQ